MKKYYGLLLIGLIILISSCAKFEEFTPIYVDFGTVSIQGVDTSDSIVYVLLDIGTTLKFNEESVDKYLDYVEDGQRVFVNYEVEEDLSQSNGPYDYVINVLSAIDVIESSISYVEPDVVDSIDANYIQISGITIADNLLNLQVGFLKKHETQLTELIYDPAQQSDIDGKNIILNLVNHSSGEELDEDSQGTINEFITFDVRQLYSHPIYGVSPSDNGIIYFDIVYNTGFSQQSKANVPYVVFSN